MSFLFSGFKKAASSLTASPQLKDEYYACLFRGDAASAERIVKDLPPLPTASSEKAAALAAYRENLKACVASEGSSATACAAVEQALKVMFTRR